MMDRYETNRFRYLGNRFVSSIIKNILWSEREMILQSNYEFILKSEADEITFIKPGINFIRKNKSVLKRGWWLVVIKFWKSNLTMHIENGTLMEEIYGRAAKWIDVIPSIISFSGRLYPGGPKIKNIDPNVVARNEVNAVSYLKLEIGDTFITILDWFMMLLMQFY
jgi:hypothetical protein